MMMNNESMKLYFSKSYDLLFKQKLPTSNLVNVTPFNIHILYLIQLNECIKHLVYTESYEEIIGLK